MPGTPQCWSPKPDTPPYIPISVTDIYKQVQEKWTSLGSPDAQCPSPEFGEVGSAENDACRARVAPLWEAFEEVFPDVPQASPYNRIVDLVLAEEVCALGYYSDPEADIGPAPNLFQNPQGLAQKLQEWHMRSLVPSLCQPCENTPGSGDCYCWPYRVTTPYRYKSSSTDGWRYGTSICDTWGPFRGMRVLPGPPPSEPDGNTSWNLQVSSSCSLPFFDAQPFKCEVGVFWHDNVGSSSLYAFEIVGGSDARAFTRQECIDYFQQDRIGPVESGACPRLARPPRLPELPNTAMVYMPLPVPILSFPPPASCPTSPEDYVNIVVNLPSTPGPAGPPGADGEKGKDGDGYMRIKKRKAQYQILDSKETDSGDFGGSHSLPPGIAYVSVRWKLSGSEQVGNRVRRFNSTFDPSRLEFAYGNAYLRQESTGDTLGPFLHASLNTLLVEIPDLPGERWQLLVNDKGDCGYDVIDAGYRWDVIRISNPEEVPEVEYPID